MWSFKIFYAKEAFSELSGFTWFLRAMNYGQAALVLTSEGNGNWEQIQNSLCESPEVAATKIKPIWSILSHRNIEFASYCTYVLQHGTNTELVLVVTIAQFQYN